MGQPVAGNPTQYMMEKAFAACGLDWRYLTLEVPAENLEDAVRGMKAMGFHGGNFTMPHKQTVIPLLDGLSEAAAMMGAVNCVNRVDDPAGGEPKYVGENTDGKGFVQSLRELTDPAGKQIAILGAGGAARAIAVELAIAGAGEITIVNRTAEHGQELVDLLTDKAKVAAKYIPWTGDYEVEEATDVLINGTSIGLFNGDEPVPINYDSLNKTTVVADVVFNPPNTYFLREARQRGCQTLDGLGMLVNQAVIGFKIWTGVDPDPVVMREALEEYLEL